MPLSWPVNSTIGQCRACVQGKPVVLNFERIWMPIASRNDIGGGKILGLVGHRMWLTVRKVRQKFFGHAHFCTHIYT